MKNTIITTNGQYLIAGSTDYLWEGLRTQGRSAKHTYCGENFSLCSFLINMSMTYGERENDNKSR